jgi:glycerol-3-phosphate dehydrogenase subunit B
LIAGPAGWRDFYPTLCADNLARQGVPAQGVYFDLAEMLAASQFDLMSVGLARLFEQADVRAKVAAQLLPRLNGAGRVGLPAVLGLERHAEAWQDLQDRLGVAVFEIPTLPPSVPGIRLYQAFKNELARAGVQILLDMTVTRGLVENGRASAVIVPGAVRELTYRAETVILATGGLYGGGIASNHRGEMREVVFDLPLQVPGCRFQVAGSNEPQGAYGSGTQAAGGLEDWFAPKLLAEHGHPVYYTGVRANSLMQPVDEAGHVVIGNVRVAGKALAGYNALVEGSAEGVWLATAYRAATQ